jgi:hypothetical protein
MATRWRRGGLRARRVHAGHEPAAGGVIMTGPICRSLNRDSNSPLPSILRVRTNRFILGAMTQSGARCRGVFKAGRVNWPN